MRCSEINSVARSGASLRCSSVSLAEYFRSSSDARHQSSKRHPPTPFDGSSAGPPGSAEVPPRAAIGVALGIQDLRTRVFRGVELQDHPLRIWNARIRRRVKE